MPSDKALKRIIPLKIVGSQEKRKWVMPEDARRKFYEHEGYEKMGKFLVTLPFQYKNAAKAFTDSARCCREAWNIIYEIYPKTKEVNLHTSKNYMYVIEGLSGE